MLSTAGLQDISLHKGGCIFAGIAAHEFLHAIGFSHEQCRPDRNSYLTINWNNIDAGYFYLILKIIFIFKCFFIKPSVVISKLW